ncbi:MAG TPA: response regulator [Kofleriaceae bacterium]|nr:response regulator [Kofleriaceae bacterium]
MSKIVLCVDDSATMQQVADITFRGTEFTYVGARGYDEGLDKARSQKPTVVLADSHMPGHGKSGYDLCLALKSDPGTAHVPVVILVGNSAPYDNVRGIQVGADANLPKPWDTQTMLEKVTEIVGKAASGVARPGQVAVSVAAPAAAAAAPAASGKGVPAPVPVAAAASAAMPPRSATIMGMPTIKMPAGGSGPGTQPPMPAAAMAAAPPSKTNVMAVPPISPVSSNSPGAVPSIRSPAPPPPAQAATGMAPSSAMSRAPMVSGTPTRRSQLVERTLAKMAARLAEASGLEPGSPELAALLKLSIEVVERIVWEVVPDLAEQIIRENLHDLTARRS